MAQQQPRTAQDTIVFDAATAMGSIELKNYLKYCTRSGLQTINIVNVFIALYALPHNCPFCGSGSATPWSHVTTCENYNKVPSPLEVAVQKGEQFLQQIKTFLAEDKKANGGINGNKREYESSFPSPSMVQRSDSKQSSASFSAAAQGGQHDQPPSKVPRLTPPPNLSNSTTFSLPPLPSTSASSSRRSSETVNPRTSSPSVLASASSLTPNLNSISFDPALFGPSSTSTSNETSSPIWGSVSSFEHFQPPLNPTQKAPLIPYQSYRHHQNRTQPQQQQPLVLNPMTYSNGGGQRGSWDINVNDSTLNGDAESSSMADMTSSRSNSISHSRGPSVTSNSNALFALPPMVPSASTSSIASIALPFDTSKFIDPALQQLSKAQDVSLTPLPELPLAWMKAPIPSGMSSIHPAAKISTSSTSSTTPLDATLPDEKQWDLEAHFIWSESDGCWHCQDPTCLKKSREGGKRAFGVYRASRKCPSSILKRAKEHTAKHDATRVSELETETAARALAVLGSFGGVRAPGSEDEEKDDEGSATPMTRQPSSSTTRTIATGIKSNEKYTEQERRGMEEDIIGDDQADKTTNTSMTTTKEATSSGQILTGAETASDKMDVDGGRSVGSSSAVLTPARAPAPFATTPSTSGSMASAPKPGEPIALTQEARVEKEKNTSGVEGEKGREVIVAPESEGTPAYGDHSRETILC